MACICKCVLKNKKLEKAGNGCQSQDSCASLIKPPGLDCMETSASELSYLKAEVWSLQTFLKEAKNSESNLSEAVTKIAEEKYELLEELNEMKILNEKMFQELAKERDLHATEKQELLTELLQFQHNQARNEPLMETLIRQNIELKASAVEANETIYQMGIMYLRLKKAKSSGR